jgi:hypothetical protein
MMSPVQGACHLLAQAARSDTSQHRIVVAAWHAAYPAEGPSLNMEDSVVPLSINTSHHENEEDEFKRLLYVPTGQETATPQILALTVNNIGAAALAALRRALAAK